MLVSQYDPRTLSAHTTTIDSIEKLEPLLREWLAKKSPKPNSIPLALVLSFQQGNEPSLMIAQTEAGVVLSWINTKEQAFHSVSDKQQDGLIQFDYMGSWSEVPAQFAVPIEMALRAAISFFQTGRPILEEGHFEVDF